MSPGLHCPPARRRRRGFALLRVIVFALALGGAAAAWRASFAALHAFSARSADRARARAVAESAWERARLHLSRGQEAGCPLAPVLDGEAAVLVRAPQAGRREVEVQASVRRQGGTERVYCRLVLEVEVGPGGRLRVRERREEGS